MSDAAEEEQRAELQRVTLAVLLSGDGRPETHGRTGGGQSAAAGTSERSGHPDQHREVAGD